MIKLKAPLILFLLFLFNFSYAQIEEYDYKRTLTGVNDKWHKLILPNDLFEKVNADISDIRIFGITESNDTIEAPFFLQKKEDQVSKKEFSFQLVNTVYNNRGSFFTLALSQDVSINQMILSFEQENFDWELKLEGSNNQRKWFTIVDDYRILSIKNSATNYQFTTVNFPSARYRFFRLSINSKKVDLLQASISLNDLEAGNYQDYPVKSFHIEEDKNKQQTKIDIDLGMRVPISSITLDVENDFDYYRPISIEYLVDSFETKKGWQYNYSSLSTYTRILSSIESKEFNCSSTLFQKARILINNQNNQPLDISSIQIKGPVYEILARFTEDAGYFLVYGKKNDHRPDYDISRFSKGTIDEVGTMELGTEQIIEKVVIPPKPPLIENKAWLWAIMGIIMLLLGWFSVKMIKNT